MDLPLALLMEQYLAAHGTASVEEFAQGCAASVAACRREVPRLLAYGAELDARGHVQWSSLAA